MDNEKVVELLSQAKNDFTVLYKILDMLKEDVGRAQAFIANEKSNYILKDFLTKYPDEYLRPNERILINKLELIKQNKYLVFENLFYLINGLKRASLSIEFLSKRGEDVFNFIPSINLSNYLLYIFLGSYGLANKDDFVFNESVKQIQAYLSTEGIKYEDLVIGDLKEKEMIESYILDGERRREIKIGNEILGYDKIFETIKQLNAFSASLLRLLTDNLTYSSIKSILNEILEKISYARARIALAEAMGYKNFIINKVISTKVSSIEDFLNLMF